MLSNDENKRIMLRFKKSKDFYKTCSKLEKEGYTVYKSSDNGAIINGIQTNKKIILVGKGANHLVTVNYHENEDKNSEYKQVIDYITY